ncbi:MAG: hypothetical protein DDT26_01976 [Dehalococcoidia bacterium]|nr:hypothetical protein [Chloroflexota bacterium]
MGGVCSAVGVAAVGMGVSGIVGSTISSISAADAFVAGTISASVLAALVLSLPGIDELAGSAATSDEDGERYHQVPVAMVSAIAKPAAANRTKLFGAGAGAGAGAEAGAEAGAGAGAVIMKL